MADYQKLEKRDSMDNFKVQSIYGLMTKTSKQIEDDLGMESGMDREQGDLNKVVNDASMSRKSLFNRIFSPMEAGSLRGSIFAMSSLALGTGCLALPKSFSHMSLSLALTVLLLGGTAAYWSLIIMIEASRKSQLTEYSRLVKESLGSRLALFLDIMILIYIFGILISYQVISKPKIHNDSLSTYWFLCLRSGLDWLVFLNR
jgi:hypothetical protein